MTNSQHLLLKDVRSFEKKYSRINQLKFVEDNL